MNLEFLGGNLVFDLVQLAAIAIPAIYLARRYGRRLLKRMRDGQQTVDNTQPPLNATTVIMVVVLAFAVLFQPFKTVTSPQPMRDDTEQAVFDRKTQTPADTADEVEAERRTRQAADQAAKEKAFDQSMTRERKRSDQAFDAIINDDKENDNE